MKRFLGIILSLVLVFGTISIPTFATDIDEINDFIINGNDVDDTDNTNEKGELNITFLDDSNQPVSGADFTLKNSDGVAVHFTVVGTEYKATINGFYPTVTTDSNGFIKISNLNIGNYTLEYNGNISEITAKNPIKLTVIEGSINDTYKLSKTNSQNTVNVNSDLLANGSIEFNLTDQDNEGIPGVSFKLLNDENKEVLFSGHSGVYRITDKEPDKILTNANGNIFLRGLKDGNYTLMQIEDVDGYVGQKISRSIAITNGQTIKENGKLQTSKGSLMLEFIDPKTDSKISEGKYILKDEKTGEPLEFTGNQGVYTRKSGSSSEIIPYNGYVNISGLNPGSYTIESTLTPGGYSAVKKEGLIVSPSHETRTQVELSTAQGVIEITVTDEISKKPVEGYELKLLDKDNNQLYVKKDNETYVFSKEKTADIMLTDNSGRIMIDQVPVDVYKISEAKPAKGYIKSKKDNALSVFEGDVSKIEILAQRSNAAINFMDERGLPVENVKLSINDKDDNRVFSGQSNENGKVLISGVKAGEYTYRARGLKSPYMNKIYEGTLKIDENGDITGLSDQVVETNKAIIKTNVEGAYFKITNKDGTYEEELATDSNGEITFENLADDEYTIIQTDGPDDYKIIDEKIEFEINRKTREEKEFTVSLPENIPEETNIDNEEPVTNKPISKGLIIGCVAFLILCCAGYSWYAINKKDKKTEQIKTNEKNQNEVKEESKKDEALFNPYDEEESHDHKE